MQPTESAVDLVRHAIEARQRAYAPYSNYQVGAAVLTSDGNILIGCNVENASYPATICAERVALTAAVAQGYQDFVAIAVATQNGGTPCGICRQSPTPPAISARQRWLSYCLAHFGVIAWCASG